MMIPLLFIFIGTVSLIHTNVTKNFIGFELVTLVTIVSSMAYGATTGAIVGVTSIVFGLILGRSIDFGIVISIIGFILIAIVSSMFQISNIFLVGVILTLVYDIMLISFYYISGSDMFTVFSYFITHLLINIFIFTTVAPFFIKIVFP